MQSDHCILPGYEALHDLRIQCWIDGVGITYVPGCWDGRGGGHLGHAICVDHCKQRRPNNILVVGVATDETVRWLKSEPGDPRPLATATVRMRFMATQKPVDRVIEVVETGQAGADGDELIALLLPDTYIADKNDRSLIRKRLLCRKYGIEFLTHSRYEPWNAPGISTTMLERQQRCAA